MIGNLHRLFVSIPTSHPQINKLVNILYQINVNFASIFNFSMKKRLTERVDHLRSERTKDEMGKGYVGKGIWSGGVGCLRHKCRSGPQGPGDCFFFLSSSYSLMIYLSSYVQTKQITKSIKLIVNYIKQLYSKLQIRLTALYLIKHMFENFQCMHHIQQPLNLLCLSSDCNNKTLLCYLCKLEHHQNHKPTISLRLFVEGLLSAKSSTQSVVFQTSLIDQQLLSIQGHLSKLKGRIHEYSSIEQTFLIYWRNIIKQILLFDHVIQELQTLLQENAENQYKKLQVWIQKYSKMFISEKQQQDKTNFFTNFLKNKLSLLKQITYKIQRIEQKAVFQDSDILSLFIIEPLDYNLKIHFSEELMGSCMKIISPTKACMSVSGNQRMILLAPALSNSLKIKKWKVKIDKLASWIGVGVAHLDSVKSVNFDFSYTNANHGNYLISSNGYSWNGYKMQFNSKHEPFQFKTGDTIEIIYDPQISKVTFSKQNVQTQYTYDIDPSQKPIHAAINLTGVDDCVEIFQ